MMAPEPAEQGRKAFLWACGLDVAVRKPGNVSVVSSGHAMEAAQFLASAQAAAGPLFAQGATVGARIEGAVAATRAVAGCNTNLGIVLLCAPLAAALERIAGEAAFDLRSGCEKVLEALDVADAGAAYRAIALANPGGLGRAETQDVARAPTVTLRQAMSLAADRDSVARQYANAYADIFDVGIPALATHRGRLGGAVQAVFLTFLAGWPDSHIVRKLGGGVAQTVTEEAVAWQARLATEADAGEGAAFAEWDERLKTLGINPGTSADLTVCTLFAAALMHPGLTETSAGENWHGSCIPSPDIGRIPTSE